MLMKISELLNNIKMDLHNICIRTVLHDGLGTQGREVGSEEETEPKTKRMN